MIKRLTPQIAGSYAKAFGVDTLLKTKPIEVYTPKARVAVESMVGSWRSVDPFEYLSLPKEYKNKSFIYVDRLLSKEQGGGTTAIKRIVRDSIEKGYDGRVALHACMIDPDRGHPFLFYYKLGFRSTNGIFNWIADKILKSRKGSSRLNMYMLSSYFMYLPKENVGHCLNYKTPATKLTYAPETKLAAKSKRETKAFFAEAYKKFFGVDSILKTKKPEVVRIDPRVDVETVMIEKFSPMFTSEGKYPTEYIGNPVTYIEVLDSFKKGDGTRAIKDIVRKSLKDKSEGRVALRACIIDFEKGSPIGFYYKLGFRSVDEKYNKICEEWLKKGGKMEDRPGQIKYWIFAPQQMYLPKENIEHCLHYPEKTLKLC